MEGWRLREAVLAGFVCGAVATFGAMPATARSDTPATDESSGVVLAPQGEFYPLYLADVHRAGTEYMAVTGADSGIPQTSGARYMLRVGGRLGLVGHEMHDRSVTGWQVGIEGGFISDYDRDFSADNIGWDGLYGLVLTAALTPDVHIKFGAIHRSSHLGDEYIERTGQQRINYTREEWLAGVGWYVTSAWRVYGEIGHAFTLRNEALQEPGRVQVGLEYVPARRWWNKQLGWFAALDVSAMEERDWRADAGLRVGYHFDRNGQRWTLGFTYYRGRPRIGEFFQYTETYAGIGLMMDLY